MATTTRTFQLKGPLEGKTINLGGFVFDKGEFTFTGSADAADKLQRYMQRCWQVVTLESDEAVVSEKQENTTADEKPTQTQEMVASRIQTALVQLDPADDSLWTQTGKPAMTAIETIYGSADITRAMVDAAIPGFDREAAYAAQSGVADDQTNEGENA